MNSPPLNIAALLTLSALTSASPAHNTTNNIPTLTTTNYASSYPSSTFPYPTHTKLNLSQIIENILLPSSHVAGVTSVQGNFIGSEGIKIVFKSASNISISTSDGHKSGGTCEVGEVVVGLGVGGFGVA